MRFFIALDIPEQNKKELAFVQNRVKDIIPNFLLTDPLKLHLTIAFIGEQDASLQKPLSLLLEESVSGVSPFILTPAFIDGFPNLHKAHTFWLGVKGDTDKLFIIRERVKDGLIRLNLEADERRFIPHIAIGKVNNFELTAGEERSLEQLDMQTLSPIPVNSLKLFESIPNQGFHHHNTLAEVKL